MIRVEYTLYQFRLYKTTVGWRSQLLEASLSPDLQLTECTALKGAQWLSGRVLDSRPKGSGFEPHRRHCVVVLEQGTFILA